MRWLRKSQLDPLAVTMSGVKLADRLLVLGGSDTALIGALAGKAGLTGRTVVVDASPAVTSASATAVERDGHLIESFTAPWSMLPFDPHAFDVVVVRDVLNALSPEERLRCAQEVHRVLRPGGRAVVIEGKTQSLLGGLLGATPPVDLKTAGAEAPATFSTRQVSAPPARSPSARASSSSRASRRTNNGRVRRSRAACCVPARAASYVALSHSRVWLSIPEHRESVAPPTVQSIVGRNCEMAWSVARQVFCPFESRTGMSQASLPVEVGEVYSVREVARAAWYPSVMSSDSLPPRRYRRSAAGS